MIFDIAWFDMYSKCCFIALLLRIVVLFVDNGGI